ncbi:unnamed protein product [Brachionus calyciflorus]|uniref:Uncharacterized protein n=1 Tax=Brachionus calyciflorus TaxID=104777 RepID=A0A813SCI8_9BILA|nr:unnamed protein product [Brachionus calyciflorus]
MSKIYSLLIYLYMIKATNFDKCTRSDQSKYNIDKKLLIAFSIVNIKVKIKQSLSEINPSCLLTYLESKDLITNLNIDPQNNFVSLKNSFYLKNFTYFNQDNLNEYGSLKLNFRKLDKLDLNSSNIFTFFIDKYLYKEVIVNLFDSIFNSKFCHTSTQNGIFNRLTEVSLSYTVKFFTDTCPLIFQNSSLQVLKIYGQSNSLIKFNILDFMDLNMKTINSRILEVSIQFYKANLTQKTLNKLVFKNVEKIQITGLVNFIENNIFEKFSNLIFVYLKIENFQYTLSHNNKWLDSMKRYNSNNSKIVYIKFDIIFEDSFYLFPDSDLCFFRHFPHHQLVYPLFNNMGIIERNCSCTLLWLLKETYSLRNNLTQVDDYSRYLTYDNYEPCFSKSEFIRSLEKCDFDSRFKLCDSMNHNIEKETSMLEYEYIFKIILYFLVLLSPILGVLALVSNCLNIKVVFEIRPTDKNSQMNRTILFNSIINIIYIFIFMLHMMNQCISQQGIFCSSVNRSIYSQYFYIYIFLLFGNFLKLLSNLSSMSISIFRFILLDNNEKSFFFSIFVKRGRLLVLILAIFSIVYFLLYFMVVFFTTSINREIFILDDLYHYIDFPDTGLFVLSYLSKRTSITKDYSTYIFGLFVINYVLNDLIIFLILCLVEILVLVRAKACLRNKIKMIGCSTRSKLKLQKSVDKTTKIILGNILFTIVFRAIDFAISTYLVDKRIGSQFERKNLCFSHSRICHILTEINEFTFLFSISFNFFIYYHLNLNFRQVIKNRIKIRNLKFFKFIKFEFSLSDYF